MLSYKKPAFWIIIAAVVACAALAVGFLTNPQTDVEDDLGVFIDGRIAEHHQSKDAQGRACCVDWEVLGVDKNFKGTTVYMWVLYKEYSNENGVQEEAGAHIPTVITVKKENGNYKLVEYWEPRDGSYNVADIKAKFPWYLHRKALDPQRYIESQQANCWKMAEEYFSEVHDESARLLQLVDEIADNPDVAFSSNPYDYIKAKQALYDEILTYGDRAVACFVGQLRTTGENGLRGYIMAAACAELTGVGEDKSAMRWGSAQEWLALYEAVGKEKPGDTLSNMEAFARLKQKYSQWFGLDTAKGLEVLVWQMAPNCYTCRLHSGKNLTYGWEDLLSVEGTTIEEMKWILSSYNVEREDVVIVPYQHPLSSYWYEIDEEYQAKLEELFWGPVEEAGVDADECGLTMDAEFAIAD